MKQKITASFKEPDPGRKRKIKFSFSRQVKGKPTVNVYDLECGHRVTVPAAADRGRKTHKHFICRACRVPVFNLSNHGPRRLIVKTTREVYDGLRLNVYKLECGHVIKLRSVYDTSKGRARSRLCGECAKAAKKASRPRRAA